MRKFSFTGILKGDGDVPAFKKLPERSTSNSMAYDFYSPIDFIVKPKQTYLLKTGIKAKFPKDNGLILNVRSSMGKKHIMLANSSGWIDSDYYENPDNDGEIGFLYYNYGDTPWEVKAGEKIGQGMFIKFFVTDNDNSITKRTGGWGSTNE